MSAAARSARRPGRIHAARLESPRLSSVHELLLRASRRARPEDRRLSTRDLVRGSGHLAINSIVSELRANGVIVKCEPETRDGKTVHVYWIPRPAQASLDLSIPSGSTAT